MQIAICDDEHLFRSQLMEFTKEYASMHPRQEIEVFEFSQAEDLIEAAGRIGGFDIYLLDIVIPGMNGIELGVQLRRIGSDGRILYLTSSSEYAVDSFRAKPFNYILKPLKRAAFHAALDEATASIASKKEKSLIVKTNESSVKLNLNNILYAQLQRRTICYHLTDGSAVESILIRTTFSETVQELLRDKRFVLCGASIVVNLHHITMVEKDALLFANTFKLYIPRKACASVRSAWYDYWFDGEGKA